MNIPAFTASASLYRTRTNYRSSGIFGSSESSAIIPQLPDRDAPGRGGCFADCIDKRLTKKQCHDRCGDPGGTQGSGGGSRPADANAVCWAGYGICTAVGFSTFRPDLWASCLFGGICSCEELRDHCFFD